MKKSASSAVSFIDLSDQQKLIQKELDAALRRIFSTQKFILGEYGRQLEAEIAEKIGAKYAIGVANGSDAIYLALLALGVGPGDEVITTPFSFFATAGSISRTGALPVFADIDPVTFNLDPAGIQARISKKTKAIVPVHLFGQPCDMAAILKIAGRRSIPVIEDAAQSFGASYRGRQTGSIGDAGCFSFYPTKNLGGAGDGGMITTSSAPLAEKIKMLRNHGMRDKYHHETVGINSRLDEIQAAVVLAKLKWISRWNDLRVKNARVYSVGLKGLPLQVPATTAYVKPTYHLYSVLADRRDDLHLFLTERKIGSGIYYPLPLHLQPCYRSLGYKAGDLPVSEKVSKNILSLPMYPEISRKALADVILGIRTFYGG